MGELYGFGDTRKARAIWEPYMEQGLTIDESVQEIERKKGEHRNEQ